MIRSALPALAALLGASAVAAQDVTRVPPLYPTSPYTRPEPARADTLGLRLRITEADERAGPRAAPPATRLLDRAAADALLVRVRPLESAAARDSFAFPARTLPPPRSGATVAFTAGEVAGPAAPVVAGRAPLAVTRRAPEGEVPLGAEVTVAFSRPMIPLSSVGAAEARPVPVRMTPTPAGRWRWMDVRTARFEPAGRLPMATEFRVEVPAGTRAEDGTALAEAVSWGFATPPARVTGGFPYGGPTVLQPVIVAAFDGRVDPAAVLATVRLRVAGRDLPVRPATAAEVEADDDAKRRVAGLEPGRWVAFRPAQPLPRGAAVQVRFGPGTPSAEGPRVTADVQAWEFRTFGPLRVTGERCGWGRDGCRPGTPMVVTFSNPLVSGSDSAAVRVQPRIDGMRVAISGSQLMVFGETRPQTQYTVTVDTTLRDVFGQRLARAHVQRFQVRSARAELNTPYGEMVVLDPRGAPTVSVFAHDHPRLRIRVQRVGPEHWGSLAGLRAARARSGGAATLPGATAVDRVVQGRGTGGASREVPIDLAPALDGGVGQLLVAVEALDGGTAEERQQAEYFWVQATRIGIMAAAEADSLTVWASSLMDGAPIPGARVSLTSGPSATTDAHGITQMPLPGDPARPLLVARAGGDVAILAPGMGSAGWGRWQRADRPTDALWYTYTDRHLYRPGETVHFKGWLRQLPRTEGGRLGTPRPAPNSVRYRVVDARGNELAKGVVPATALGGFDGSFALPAGANLGDARVEVAAVPGSDSTQIGFSIQDFRRPEFEVGVVAEPGPHLVGGSAQLSATASYFAGGGLPGAAVDWRVASAPGHFTPAGWEAWSFGIRTPWWIWRGDDGDQRTEAALRGETDASGKHVARLHFDAARPERAFSVTASATITDVNRQTWTTSTSLLVHPAAVYAGLRTGRAWLEAGDTLALDLVAVDLDGRVVPGRPLELAARRFEWRSEDGRWTRAVAETLTCLRVSAAAPTGCTFPDVRAGDWEIAVVTTDDAGRRSRTEQRIWVTGAGARFPSARGNDERTVEMIPDREGYAPGDTAGIMLRLPFSPARGVVTLRRNGVVSVLPFSSDGPTHTLRIPIGEADVPNVIVHVEAVGATDGGEGDLPTARPTDVAQGEASLPVSTATRRLTVRTVPADSTMLPDAAGAVEVEVLDAAGRPVADAEVALVAVDEAVLALSGFRLPDPVAFFHPDRSAGVTDVRLHSLVRVVAPDLRPAPGTLVGRVLNAETGEAIGGARVAVQGDSIVTVADAQGRFRLRGISAGRVTLQVSMGGFTTTVETVEVGVGATPALRLYLVPARIRLRGAAAVEIEGLVVSQMAPSAPPPPPPPPSAARAAPKDAAAPIAIRSDFNPLAFWVPAGRTDARGRVRSTFTLPSNLTRYRVSAVVLSGADRSGLGESAITARKPLMARPSAPRFLNFGDRFELPVVVQNGTGEAIAVQVAARGDGVRFTEPGRSVTVPAFDRAEVRIAAEAVRAGPARLQVVIAGGGHTDAAELEIPVYTPATAEAFALHGQLTEGAATLPLEVPDDAIPAFGGLEVSASSTALSELTDAFLYLVRYPFECAEQKASRILAVAALRDVLTAMNAAGLPSPAEIEGSLRDDVRDLVAMQNRDGGWGFWPTPGGESWPYVSIHVAHALERARAAGVAVPEGALQNAQRYLRAVPRNAPAWYPPEARRALHAYALYTRDRIGADVTGEVRAFLEAHGSVIGLEEAGWLLSVSAGEPALAAERVTLLRLVNNRATETPSTATFATRYSEGEYLLLHSSRRTDAIVLEGLLAADSASELATKTVRGLLGHRVQGRWNSTQENSWVLLALNRYFRAYESQTPDFVARVWLGERYAGGAEFRGRGADRAEVRVPMSVMQREAPRSLTIGREGTGRLYYRAGLRYAPRDLDVTPLQRGFAVERTYEAVDDPADVQRGADGIWRVRAGARVRVTVSMTTPSRRVHVALVDPMPAGWEPVNPELRGAQPTPARPVEAGARAFWRPWWFDHQNLRDDRAEAFAALVPAGVHSYSYTARATTPGIYVVPPPRAEEMYAPETFGRGATERVIVQ